MRNCLPLVMALLLTGCGLFPRRGEAPPADAPAMCYLACTPTLTDTGVRWEADPEDPDAWDQLGDQVVKALTGISLTCEARRQACVDFIQSLKRRGVIRGTDP